jgi:SAM-dependent methyltransferase
MAGISRGRIVQCGQGPCADNYSFQLTPGWQDAERAAIGGNVGVNGYTTIAQADLLADGLEIGAGSLLLDLGCGRGWPGAYIAKRTGCHAVLTDMPRPALAAASVEFGGRADVAIVRSTGANLPFPPRSFDAISHADVLC